jgi:acyl carrier protein
MKAMMALGCGKGGVYLITGAMGDVSLMLAEYLAKTVRAKLVLIEHPDTPSRDEWGQRKLQAIQELSPVLFISADVANLEQMQAAIAQIDERFGELHGVIHAAETNEETSFRPIQQTGIRECESHFQPKVQGLFVLEQVLQGRSLDFCLLQSSLSSLVGGFAAHAAANLFMDAFAHQQNQTSAFPWVSINWEGWQFWEARQMAAMEGTTAEWALLPEEGVNAFQRLLGITDAPQIVVSTINLQARMAQQRQRQSTPSPGPQQGDAISHAPRPDLQNADNAPRNQIEQAIANIWQELLGIESIGIYDNFFELGGHSLLAVQTISRLREIFQVEIPLRSLLLETPTIAGLAEAIAANQPKQQDLEEMAQLLAEIENLSIDQVQAKLAEQSQASK